MCLTSKKSALVLCKCTGWFETLYPPFLEIILQVETETICFFVSASQRTFSVSILKCNNKMQCNNKIIYKISVT